MSFNEQEQSINLQNVMLNLPDKLKWVENSTNMFVIDQLVIFLCCWLNSFWKMKGSMNVNFSFSFTFKYNKKS